MSLSRIALLSGLLLGCPGGSHPEPAPVDPDDPEETGEPAPDVPAHEPSSDCAGCHVLQHQEWQGSAMHRAASPTFAAFEIAVNRASGGAFAHGSGTANEDLCNGCHIPVAVAENQPGVFDPDDPMGYGGPLEGISDNALDGLTCDFCHTIEGVDASRTPGLDGVGTAQAFVRVADGSKQGPIEDPLALHAASENPFLADAAFCGTCHDVRPFKPDPVTGEPFLRVEDAYSEWLASPWSTDDNPTGAPVTCQDCHMSLYPLTAPGQRPTLPISVVPGNTPPRPHALHAFTAVSPPLAVDERYPFADAPDQVDGFGYPMGQEQRRELLLRAACTLDLSQTPSLLDPDASHLPITVVVENVGAGHRVPTGFSQEREVWVELVVSDDAGVIYESGTLVDSAHPETGEGSPDGLLDDEDLRHRVFHVDLETLEAEVSPGPDANQRPLGQNLGLVNFTNDFLLVDVETGASRVVFSPVQANTVDNSRSLPPLQPQTWRYDVPLPSRPLVGDIVVSARLRYRAFPPEFLRVLAGVAPQLVDEALIDRNHIVDMAEDARLVRIKGD